MKRRIIVIAFLLVMAVFLVVAVVRNRSSAGIDVTVINRGPDTITDVEIQGQHHGYPLGKLSPGSTGSGRITTGSQSDIAVEFRDTNAIWHRVESGVVFKRSERGNVTIEIEGCNLAKLEQHIEPK